MGERRDAMQIVQSGARLADAASEASGLAAAVHHAASEAAHAAVDKLMEANKLLQDEAAKRRADLEKGRP